MKMKNSVMSALLALSMTACVESTPSLQIGSVSAQGADCSLGGAAGSAGLLRGALNLGIRPAAGGYPLVLAVNSNLAGTLIEVSGRPVSGDADLNTIYLTELVLGYSSPTEGLDLASAKGSVPVHGTVSGDGRLLLNLLTSAAATELERFVRAGVTADVLVNVQLRGKRVSGDEVESNEIIFPLNVANVPFTCPPGTTLVPVEEACSQAGLNGVLPRCAKAQ
jgi:hypothetical protein